MNSPRKSGVRPTREPSFTCACIGPKTGKLCGLARNHCESIHEAHDRNGVVIELWPRAKRKGRV